MVKIALFSDLHGNLPGFQAVLEGIRQAGGADLLVAAGDLLGGGPGAADMLELLLENNVTLIRGNWEEILCSVDESYLSLIEARYHGLVRRMSGWLLERLSPAHLDLLAGLPLTLELEPAPGQKVLVCHAAPNDPWARTCGPDHPPEFLQRVYGSNDAAVVVYGHLHQHHTLLLGTRLLINVSSVGLRQDGLSAFTILSFNGTWQVRQFQVPYNVEEERRLMQERGVPVPD